MLGVYHYHKPPVTYAITSAGYAIFGINEFGARFFLQIAFILQIFLIYSIALLLMNDKKVALTAAIIYLSLPLVLVSVRNVTTDAFLNTFILGSIFSWLYYIKQRKAIFIYVMYICLGLIMNTKGPIGLLFPLIFMISYLIIYKCKVKFNWHHFLGFLLFAVLSVSWVYALSESNPRILDYFLNEQIADRITSGSFNRGKPFWYYLVILPLVILPWLMTTIVSMKHAVQLPKRRASLLMVVNIMVILLIFSLASTKLILYILPISSFIAILCADYVIMASSRFLKRQNILLVIVTAIILVALLVLPLVDSKFSISYTKLISLIAAILVGIITLNKIKITDHIRLLGFSFLFMISTVWGSVIFFNSNEIQVNSVKPIIEHIKNDTQLSEKTIVVYNYLLPSASYYANAPIITINNGHNTVKRDVRFQSDTSWKQFLIDASSESGLNQLDSLSSSNIILFTRRKHQLPENLTFLQQNLTNTIDFDKWIIYY